MGNRRRTSMRAERCAPAPRDCQPGAPGHPFPAGFQHRREPRDAREAAEGRRWERWQGGGRAARWALLHLLSIPPPAQILIRSGRKVSDNTMLLHLEQPLHSLPLLVLPPKKTWLIFLCPCAPKVTPTGQQGVSAKCHKGLRALTGTSKSDAFDRQKSALVSIKTESYQGKQESASRHSPYLQLMI